MHEDASIVLLHNRRRAGFQACRIGGVWLTWSAVAEFEGTRANADTALDCACRRRGPETKTGFERGFLRGLRGLRETSTTRIPEFGFRSLGIRIWSFAVSD